MIYVLGMPSKLVPGTSLFVMIFVMTFVTFFHAITNHNIDLILVSILMLGLSCWGTTRNETWNEFKE
jgi:uncharacterized membrane protein YfcA